jgi:hypothetical protein
MHQPQFPYSCVEKHPADPDNKACFNLTTGDIEDAPGLDSLYSYKAEVKDGKIVVTASLSEIKSKVGRLPTKAGKGIRQTQNKEQRENEQVVIVGGGSGTIHCLESLREHGYPGKITVLTRETYAPIDRWVD